MSSLAETAGARRPGPSYDETGCRVTVVAAAGKTSSGGGFQTAAYTCCIEIVMSSRPSINLLLVSAFTVHFFAYGASQTRCDRKLLEQLSHLVDEMQIDVNKVRLVCSSNDHMAVPYFLGQGFWLRTHCFTSDAP